MATARGDVYIWSSWLSRLLLGAGSCEWAVWFKAHYQYQKIEDRDWTEHRLRHTELLNRKRDEFADRGYRVLTEGQTQFRLRGRVGVLHGRPDRLAVSDTHAVLCEVKAGQAYPSHSAQLMIYMWGLPRAIGQANGPIHPDLAGLRDRPIDGLLAYEDGTDAAIPATAVDDAFGAKLAGLLQRIGNSVPAVRVPSAHECRFCNIPATECEERAAPDQILEADTDEF